MLTRGDGWLGLSVFLIILLGAGLPAESQAPLKKSAKTPTQLSTEFQALKPKKLKLADISGFRSAKFGMTEKEVLRAIAKDFKISKRKVEKKVLSAEKVTALVVHIPKLIQVGGPSDIVYLLENKSNKLIRINIDWGKSVTDNFIGKDILATANLLRNNFIKKKYRKKLYAVNTKVDETTMIVFRGLDFKGRSIVLRLISPMAKIADQELAGKHVSLVLTYSDTE
jgi:hypothetical protein